MMMPANFSAISENEMTYVNGGNWGGDGPMSSFFGDNGSLSGIVKYGIAGGSKELNGFNKFMQVVGLGAAVYQLGTNETKKYVKEVKFLGTTGKI